MKALAWIGIILTIVAGVSYSQWNAPWFDDLMVRFGFREAKVELPIVRTLTDVQGRSIEAEIIGWSGEEIAFSKSPDNSEFVVSVGLLSAEDRAFFEKIEPQREEEISRIQFDSSSAPNISPGRHATWHRDIQMAKRDAETVGIPLCLVILRSDGNISEELDRFVIRSSNFREWANSHVVLCLYYNDPGKGFVRKGLDSSLQTEAKDLAKRYGVGNRTPAFVILNPDATMRGKATGYGGETTSVVIGRLEKILSGNSKSPNFGGD